METREERAARNEAVFREVNERVEEINETLGAQDGSFLCECGDSSCAARLRLSHIEYEDVRAHGDRFVLLRGHEDVEIERVVEERDGYVVVEKLGDGAEIARDLDPRRTSRLAEPT